MKMLTRPLLVMCLIALLGAPGFASDVTIPNSFTAGTTASAAQVNANFAAVETAIDDNDARLDAMAAGGVGSAYITDGTITTADIANSAITGAKVATDTLTAANIAAGAVGTSEILDGTVTSTDIANSTITGTDIANSTITAAKIIDEPGIKNSPNTSGFALASGTAVQNAHSITVNHPAAGSVLVMVTCYLYNYHYAGNTELCRLSIDTSATGLGFLHLVGYTADLPAGGYYLSANLQRVYTVSGAGSTTYYLNAQRYYSNNSGWTVGWINMTALYFPTTY